MIYAYDYENRFYLLYYYDPDVLTCTKASNLRIQVYNGDCYIRVYSTVTLVLWYYAWCF